MKILHRYIARTIISSTFLVLLMLLGMQIFIELVNELQEIGKNNYGVWQALVYVPLLMPRDLYQFFPIAALVGCLMGLGRLASSSELIVMRAAGISKQQITGSVIRVMLVMIIFATLIGEVVAPAAMKIASNYKNAAELGATAISARQGVWVRDGNNFIHINAVLPNGHLLGVVRYQFNPQQQLQLSSYAQKADYQNNQWLFKDVTESDFYNDHIIQQKYPQQIWPVSFDPTLLGVTSINTDQTFLWGLYNYIHYLNISGLLANQYEFNFWKRVFQPLATIIMIILAIPFIFGPLRSVTMGVRILIGVMVGFGFYTLYSFFGPFSMVFQISPLWAALIPIISFAVIDGILLWWIK